jgi:hypothetical protein
MRGTSLYSLEAEVVRKKKEMCRLIVRRGSLLLKIKHLVGIPHTPKPPGEKDGSWTHMTSKVKGV